MTSVNASSQTQQIFKQGLQTVKQLKTGDMQQMGNSIFDQGVGVLTEQLNLSPEAKAALDGAIDIVKTVLMGMYNKAQLEAEDNQMISEMDQAITKQLQLSDAVNSEAENIRSETKSQADATQTELNTAVTNGQSSVVEAQKQSQEITAQTDASKAQIEKNNQEMQKVDQQIKDEQKQVKTINEKIEQAQAKGSSDPGANSELQDLMAQREGHTNNILSGLAQIMGFQTSNAELQSGIEGLLLQKQDLADSTMEISDEMAAQVDEMSGAFTDIYNNASGAINELSGLLEGQFPQFNKITCIKMACMIAKAAICGTNSGLLAAAAAELGVGSVVSFGATAAKAAQCTDASINEGGRSVKLALQQSAQKLLVDQAKVYTNQIMNNILCGISPELQQTFGEFRELYNEGVSLMADTGVDIKGGESEVTNADVSADAVAEESDEITEVVAQLVDEGNQYGTGEGNPEDPLMMGSGGTNLA